MGQSIKPRYRTTNWKHYNTALKARGSLSIWVDKRLTWFAVASGKRGRSPKFSDAAIQFCLTLKNLFGLALRQTTGLVESVLQLCGLAWSVPDFSTLCRRQRDLDVQIPYTRSKAGLHLLVGSTGLTDWSPAIPEMPAVVVLLALPLSRPTPAPTPDTPSLPLSLPTLALTPTALPSYLALFCRSLVVSAPSVLKRLALLYRRLGAGDDTALEVISPWPLTWKPPSPAWMPLCSVTLCLQRDPENTPQAWRTIWRKWNGYHRHSLVETKMGCFKRQGEWMMVRDFGRQITELQTLASILNRFTSLGMPLRAWHNCA